MRVRDWRQEDDAIVATLYADEIARWRDSLAWDTRASWRIVEAGRRSGTVTGVVADDGAGAPAGWCFALLQDTTFHVGGFVARSVDATAALIAALAGSAHGRRARRWIWFGWFDAPGLPEAISAHGGYPARYVYLRRRLCGLDDPAAPDARATAPAAVRGWCAADARLVPDLLASAYVTEDACRLFAPSGRIEEWREYVALLVNAAGCGVFDPGLSLVAGAGSGELDAAAIVTRIAPATAHLAQLAVRTGAQARGLGRVLLARAEARAAAAGCTELTLLVHEGNTRARRLYARAGFEERAAFVSAAWDADQPRTSSSDALPTGGVSTRR